MNRAGLSLCLCGAALATANILMMQRPTCPSQADVVAAFKEMPPAVSLKGKPAQIPTAAAKPAQAKKDKTANSAQGKPEQTSKVIRTKPAATPNGVDRTGSINHKKKSSQKGSDQKQAEVPLPSRKPAQSGGWNRPDRYYDPAEIYDPAEYYYEEPEYYGLPAIRFYPGW